MFVLISQVWSGVCVCVYYVYTYMCMCVYCACMFVCVCVNMCVNVFGCMSHSKNVYVYRSIVYLCIC